MIRGHDHVAVVGEVVEHSGTIFKIEQEMNEKSLVGWRPLAQSWLSRLVQETVMRWHHMGF